MRMSTSDQCWIAHKIWFMRLFHYDGNWRNKCFIFPLFRHYKVSRSEIRWVCPVSVGAHNWRYAFVREINPQLSDSCLSITNIWRIINGKFEGRLDVRSFVRSSSHSFFLSLFFTTSPHIIVCTQHSEREWEEEAWTMIMFENVNGMECYLRFSRSCSVSSRARSFFAFAFPSLED